MRLGFCLLAAAAASSTATAQGRFPRLPVIVPLRSGEQPPPAPQPVPTAVLQGSLITASGSDTVYFSPRGFSIDANAARTLTAQARWLLANPFVTIRLEGHGSASDTRDYAIAIGHRRASAARDFLVLQGIAPERISLMSWGKERPGSIRIGTTTVAAGPRVVTKIQ
ncbi:MAG TPA: OmpA family protein [Sphingomicrobium sp.]|nr:OmpA family protein [Sphingomicrobium sp.]